MIRRSVRAIPCLVLAALACGLPGGLGPPKWESVVHSQFGSMRAGDMFCAWVTHDHLHMRQLVELHRAYTERLAAPYSLEYAGPW